MAKRNQINRAPAANGFSTDPPQSNVTSLTQMFNSKSTANESSSVPEPHRSTSSHKPLPHPPTSQKQKPLQNSSPLTKRPSYRSRPQTNGHPPTPPVKPVIGKSDSGEADDSNKHRVPLMPPGSPKQQLRATKSHPEISDDKNNHPPTEETKTHKSFISKITKFNMRTKPKTSGADTKANDIVKQNLMGNKSNEPLASNLPGRSRLRAGSDGENQERVKSRVPFKFLAKNKATDVHTPEVRQRPLLPPQPVASRLPVATSTPPTNSEYEIVGWECNDSEISSPQKTSHDSGHRPQAYQNVAIGTQNLRIPESPNMNDHDTIPIQTKASIGTVSTQHVPSQYENVSMGPPTSLVPGPTNYRAPMPTTPAPPPPIYAVVGPKVTRVQTHSSQYDEVEFIPKPSKQFDEGCVSDDETLFGEGGPPGLQKGPVYANFGPDEGDRLMSIDELEQHINNKGLNGLAEEYLKIKNEPLSSPYVACRCDDE